MTVIAAFYHGGRRWMPLPKWTKPELLRTPEMEALSSMFVYLFIYLFRLHNIQIIDPIPIKVYSEIFLASYEQILLAEKGGR